MSSKYEYYQSLRDKGLITDQSYFKVALSEYEKSPHLFSDEQVNKLEKEAKSVGINFKRDGVDEENKIVGAINQLASGIVEGFTTFGWADDPDTQTEAMLNKIGHLIGFAPDIIAGVLSFGATLPGSVAKKGAFRAARLGAAKKVQKGLEYGGKKIPILSTKRDGVIQLRSVPMKAADWVIAQGKASFGSSELLRTSFVGKKIGAYGGKKAAKKFTNIVEQSAHLGIAMAVSSRKEGPEGWAKAAIHGAAAGAVFGGISNYVKIGESLASKNPAKLAWGHRKLRDVADRISDQVMTVGTKGGIGKDQAQIIDFITRGALGASYTGGLASMQGAAAPDQVYEYLLGFFFGAAARPAHEIEATRAINKEMNNLVEIIPEVDKKGNVKYNTTFNDIKETKSFKDASKEAQHYMETFQADFITETIYNRSDSISKVLMRGVQQDLDAKKKRGEVVKARDVIETFLEQSHKVKKKIFKEISAEELIKEDMKKLSEAPDINLDTLNQGQHAILFDAKNDFLPVRVRILKPTKDGKVIAKRVGPGTRAERGQVVNEGDLISQNPYNKDYKVPDLPGIPKALKGKKISELKNKDLEKLSKSFKEFFAKKRKTNKEKQGIFKQSTLSQAVNQEMYRRIEESEKGASDTQRASQKNKKDKNRIENQENNNEEKQNPANEDNPHERVETPEKDIVEILKKSVKDFNSTVMKDLYGRAAGEADSYQMYVDHVKAINKERGFDPEKSYKRPQDVKAYWTKVKRLYNDKAGRTLNETWTVEINSVYNTKKQRYDYNYRVFGTEDVDMHGNPLKTKTNINFYDKKNKKGYAIEMEYIKVTSPGEIPEMMKVGQYLNQRGSWNVAKIAEQIYNDPKNLDREGNKIRYVQYYNPNGGKPIIVPIAQRAPDKNGHYINPKEVDKIELYLKKKYADKFDKDGKEGKYLPKEYKENPGRFIDELVSNVILELRDANYLSFNNQHITATAVMRAFAKYEKAPLFQNIIKYMQYRKILHNPNARSAADIDYKGKSEKDTITSDKGQKFTREDLEKSIKRFERQIKLSDTASNRAGADVAKQYMDIYDSKSKKGTIYFRHHKTGKVTETLEVDFSIDTPAQRKHSRELYRQTWRAKSSQGDKEGIAHHKKLLAKLDAKVKKEGKLNVVIMKDWKFGQVNPDGAKIYVNGLHDSILENQGRNKKDDYIKDVIIHREDVGEGLLMNKSAAQRPDKELQAFMVANDIDVIILESGRKSNTRHKVVQVEYNKKNNKYQFIKGSKRDMFNIEKDDIYLLDGEQDVPDLPGGYEYLPRMAVLKRNTLLGTEFNNKMGQLIQEQSKGDSKYMIDYNLALKQWQKDLKTNPEAEFKINKRDLDINKLPLELIIETINTEIDSPLGKKMLETMFKQAERDILNETWDTEYEGEKDIIANVNDLLGKFDYDPLVIAIGNNKYAVEKAIKNHMMTRLTRPRIKNSFGYTRLKALTPYLANKVAKDLNDNNFYLYEDHGEVNFTIGGSSKKLKHHWKEYQDLVAKEKKAGKLNKSDMGRKNILKDGLNMAIIRSPIASASGIATLDFAGFITGHKGRGIIVSQKTLKRLGGADMDGDAVGIYGDLPNIFKKAFQNKDLVTSLEGVELTDTNFNKDWGFERKDSRTPIKDVFSPASRIKQADTNQKSKKDIGIVTNLNQDIHDFLNLMTQSDSGLLRLDANNGLFFLRAKKQYTRRTEDKNGKTVQIINEGEMRDWTAEDHLRFFDRKAAPILLNNVLDGIKNSKSPKMTMLKHVLFEQHFEFVNSKGEVLKLNTEANRAKKDGHLAILPAKVEKEYQQGRLVDREILDHNALMNQRTLKHGQKGGKINERIKMSDKVARMRFERMLLNNMQIGKEIKFKETDTTVTTLTAKEWLEAQFQGQKFTSKEIAKALAGEKVIEDFLPPILPGEPGRDILRALTPKELQMIKAVGKLKTRKGGTFIAKLQAYDPDKKRMRVYRDGESSYVEFKNIDHIDITNDYFGLFQARQEFKDQAKPKASQGSVKSLAELAENYLNQVEMHDVNGVAKYMFDSYADIAKGLRRGEFNEAAFDIDIQLINPQNMHQFVGNMLKGLNQIKKSPVLKYLKENGMITDDVNQWIQLTDALELSGKGKKGIDDALRFYKIIEHSVNRPKDFQDILIAQMTNIAAAARTELLVSQANDALQSMGIKDSQISKKLKEIVDTAFMLKATDILRTESEKLNIPQNEFNIHDAIARYRQEILPNMEVLKDGKVVMRTLKRDGEVLEMLDEVFSSIMLSDITSSRGNYQDFYQNFRSMLPESLGRLENLDKTGFYTETNALTGEPMKIESSVPKQAEKYGAQLRHISKDFNKIIEKFKKIDMDDLASYSTELDAISKFMQKVRMVQLHRPNLLKSPSIPLEHKQNFIREVRQVMDQAEVKNSKKVILQLDLTKPQFEDAISRALDQPKVKPKLDIKPNRPKTSDEQPTVKIDTSGEKPKKINVEKKDADVEKDAVSVEKEFVEFEGELIDFSQEPHRLKEIIKKRIEATMNNMTAQEKLEYLQKNNKPLNMVDLEKDISIEGLPITEAQRIEINRLLNMVEKNQEIAVMLEGMFTSFGTDIGITGRAYVGKVLGLMNGHDLRMFNNMIEDLYLEPTNMYQKFKKWAKQKRIDLSKDKIKEPDNPIDKLFHLYFYQHTGKRYLEPREMLKSVVLDKLVISKEGDTPQVRSMIVPTSTLELVRRQMDQSRQISAGFQDYFEEKLKLLFSEFASEDIGLANYKDALMEIAVDFRIWDNGNFGGAKYTKDAQARFQESFLRAQDALAKIEKEHGKFKIIDLESEKGKTKEITGKEAVNLFNKRITQFYESFQKNLILKGMKQTSQGEWVFSDEAKRVINKYGWLDTNQVNRKYRKQRHPEEQGQKEPIEAMFDRMIGLNELLWYRHEYNLIKYMKDVYPDFNPNKKPTFEQKQYAEQLRKDIPFIPMKVFKASAYWTMTGHMNYKANRKNVEKHVETMVQRFTQKVLNKGEKGLSQEFYIQYKAKKISLEEAMERTINEYRDDIGMKLQVLQQEGGADAHTMVPFIQGHKRSIGHTIAGIAKPRGESPIPGFGKDMNVLSQYTKDIVKMYTDNLSGLRGTMLIDRFVQKNALKDKDHTNAWANYMRDMLQNMLGLSSFRSLETHGMTKKEHKVLKQYVNQNLEKKDKLPYTQRHFLGKVDDLIAPGSYWYRTHSSLKGKELMNAIQKERMKRAKELLDKKNINKINRFGTIYNTFTDESAVNFIRTQETRIGKLLGYKEGEFSFWKELRVTKDAEGNFVKTTSEEGKRIALARKIKAWSNLEGKFEMLSLLFHPKTMLANFYGGGVNIYADTGIKNFKDAINHEYLLGTVFKGAKYRYTDPITNKVVQREFKTMGDIERWMAQEGFLEGMYLEEAGINANFRTASERTFAKEVIKKLFGKINKNPELSNNPTELEKTRNATILELAKKHNIPDAIMKFGSFFMRTSEIKLRRTAALAHYLNARRVMGDLTNELPFDSPVLLEIARRGIISSQYVYHSAFRTNYANTSLGRVMTRFHPYAWNSVARRRKLYREAKYAEWFMDTNSSKVFQRQLTADMMSMAMATLFVGTLWEYALSPPMSWMQDTAQWLFGDEKDRQRAFFSQWPHQSLAPLQIVTPPIGRFILPPLKSLITGDYEDFIQYNLATYAPFGRMGKDIYRSVKNPSMTIDYVTGVPFHRMGQQAKKSRLERDMDQNDQTQELERPEVELPTLDITQIK